MDHYLDIELQLDPEFSTPHLMSALFSKLHRSLISHADIGVSFPGFDALTPNLGTQLRLHSGHRSLSDLMALNWLAGMRDHVRLGCLDKVPAACQHRVVRRVQSQTAETRGPDRRPEVVRVECVNHIVHRGRDHQVFRARRRHHGGCKNRLAKRVA